MRRGLRCDGAAVAVPTNPAVGRRLAAEPIPTGWEHWDVRQTGSPAIECAFVALGLLEVARFARPNVWDVGAGLAPLAAAGRAAWTRGEEGWAPLDRIVAADLRHWRRPLVIGPDSAVRLMRGQAG